MYIYILVYACQCRCPRVFTEMMSKEKGYIRIVCTVCARTRRTRISNRTPAPARRSLVHIYFRNFAIHSRNCPIDWSVSDEVSDGRHELFLIRSASRTRMTRANSAFDKTIFPFSCYSASVRACIGVGAWHSIRYCCAGWRFNI